MMMMQSRGSNGGCCVSRYESDKMDKIMLRFRPIAPKPTTSGSSPETTAARGGAYVKISRGRKRCRNNNDHKINCTKRRKTSPEAATLPLLPEVRSSSSPKAPIWLNFNSGMAEKDQIQTINNRLISYTPVRTVEISPRGTFGTCVTLECFINTLVKVDALGRTDNERVMNLEHDTCPGFVSDRLSRITWSNAAFSKMVNVEDFTGGAWVAMKESVGEGVRAFSCRVRVQVESRTRKVMTVPCDVWRMDCGGFAWRLDVKAALSLGL